jgi:hypothetical protein
MGLSLKAALLGRPGAKFTYLFIEYAKIERLTYIFI